MAETTTASPYAYWDNSSIPVTYAAPAWSPIPVCSCEAVHDHNIWTHVYRLLTINKKIWRTNP